MPDRPQERAEYEAAVNLVRCGWFLWIVDVLPALLIGHYRQIPSLQDYLVVHQREPRVEHHRRTDDGDWLWREFFGTEHVLEIVSLGISLPMSEVYDKVQFE